MMTTHFPRCPECDAALDEHGRCDALGCEYRPATKTCAACKTTRTLTQWRELRLNGFYVDKDEGLALELRSCDAPCGGTSAVELRLDADADILQYQLKAMIESNHPLAPMFKRDLEEAR